MADRPTAVDILSEAMEYLSKLGLKLRSRSDSMKEKKIKQNRLRNSHAVKKTANKVLLLCELSKKSLNIVESTVKNILSAVGTEQAVLSDGDGGNSRNRSSTDSENKPNYFYFKYGSRKLKIVKKVSIKHYTSVKVIAKKMPKSWMKKYPVYYDSKLLRYRKAKELRNKTSPEKESNRSLTKSDQSSDEDTAKRTASSKKGASKRILQTDSEDETKNEVIPKTSDKKLKKPIIESSDSSTEDKTIVKSSSSNESKIKNSKTKDKKITESETSKKSSVINKENEDSVSHTETIPEECKSADDDVSQKDIMDTGKLIESLNACINPNLNDVAKDFDTDVDSQKCNEVSSDQKEKSAEESKKDSPTQIKSSVNEVITLDDDEDDVIPPKSPDEDSEKNDDQDSKKKNKPLIKCVNLSKLLKPTVLQKVGSQMVNNSKENSGKRKTGLKTAPDKNNTPKRVRYLDEEEFWTPIRKQVAAFKPKKFTINVSKLPEWSNKFLEQYNIKRVTQKGQIIYEIADEPCKDVASDPKHPDQTNKDPEPDILQVKNALLNDSDSEISDTNEPCSKSEKHSKKPDDEVHENDKSIKKARKNAKKKSTHKKKRGSSEEKSNETDNENSHKTDEENKHSDEDQDKSSSEKKSKPIEDNSEEENEKSGQKNRSKQSSKEKSCEKRDDDKSMHSDTDMSKQEDKSKENDKDKSKDSDEEKSRSCADDTLKCSDTETSKEKSKSKDEDGSEHSNEEQSQSNDDNKSKCSDEENSKNGKEVSPSSGEEKLKISNKEKSASDDSSNDKDAAKFDDKEKTPERCLDNDKDKNDSCLIISSTEKSKNSEETPSKSRRKHIMESMKAKRMLLTYSSSDTEDDKLNAVLKEIKGSLLKEGSSDEDKTKKPKIYSSSEPEIEPTKVKKKHKKSSKRKSESRHEERGHKKMGRSTDKAGGSSQSSDTQDDKDIDRLANMKSLSKSRRRGDTSSTSTDEKTTRSSSRKKITVAPLITGEGLLEAPDSSDNTDPESDAVEDLPPISLSGLNGGSEGLTHLAKDDLLGDSDSSSSNDNDKDEQEKNDEDSDDEDVKLKRRKANTISSDSDVGKPKKSDDKDARMSDFEDSEDESSEPAKRKRKKKPANDSDASGSGSDAGKKKRRRIKQIDDSDASGSDSENEGKKHGRKNIRKVMGKNQLEEATKKAAREEKERMARIAERQKLYNNLDFDETGKPDEVIPDKLVLDFDLETKEPIIEVDKGLVKKLKPHQANGIRFMWDACFESAKRIKKDRGSGCILAHCMGLGKTLQVVALTHTLLTHSELTNVNRVLVVCPLSTVLNWVNEFNMWLKHANKEKEVDVYELSRFKQNSERAYQLSQWLKHGGVCVLGYEMFRNLSADNPKKYKKKMLKNFQEALVDPGPDLVVCDEGHLLKNEKTSLSQSMNRVRTRRRIVLTGTPLQNNLKEYYCMVQFVKPNLLGKYNEYLNRFVNPITNGQYTDSTEHDIKVMKRRSHVLHKMLDGAVQRRDYSVLAPFLPPKHEYVLFITLSEVQIKLYQNYLDNYSRRPLPGKSSGFLFPDFQSLQRIWTHPLVLKYNSERYEIMQQKKREREEEDSEGSLVDFIDDDSTPDESSTEESSDDLSDLSDDSRKKSKKKKSAKKSKAKDGKGARRGTRANPVELVEPVENIDVIEVKNDNPTEWWIPLVTDDELEDIRHSHKLMLLFDILRQCEAIGDKLLVFSQSLYSLDLIEHFLGKVDEATQEGRIDEKLGGHVGSWSPGVDYFRLDGSTSCENRSIWCKNFNREDNPRARLFLISTRAGGLGINLVAANRVIIFDVSWNPSHDVQSIFRVYRFGQKKPCYIYRFLVMGTMEEKIYERQVTKQAISKRVIDEQQIDRHYKENDLAELYKFEPRPPVPRPVPPVPKDRMFAELLKTYDNLIYKFHEHDSLLENKEEETLSEEERKAAWEDFENEKNRPPPAPYPQAWPMHNGMVNNLLAQQQQQLAYAALATMLRKDMPNISDDQLRNMLPLIYGANPGLMQKLSDIYKYPGAGMMNPILNTVMNSGSNAAGMGGGGTSGLQYEPPWMRDQQQQQQIRLQQLMQQQQNSMGAKLYAGGLGSRDPVAMALQQQRAREMMMQQQAAGRQRGRPPLAPRPPAASDVVTLDSD